MSNLVQLRVQSIRGFSTKSHKYQNPSKASPPSLACAPITTIANSGNKNHCFLSSSTKWIIDFAATAHMTDNPKLFYAIL